MTAQQSTVLQFENMFHFLVIVGGAPCHQPPTVSGCPLPLQISSLYTWTTRLLDTLHIGTFQDKKRLWIRKGITDTDSDTD